MTTSFDSLAASQPNFFNPQCHDFAGFQVTTARYLDERIPTGLDSFARLVESFDNILAMGSDRAVRIVATYSRDTTGDATASKRTPNIHIADAVWAQQVSKNGAHSHYTATKQGLS